MVKKRMLLLALLLLSLISGIVLFTILAGGFGFDVIFILIIVALFLAYSIPQFLSSTHDKVYDDEFTKKTLRLASSRSFYISIYMWLALLWFGDLFENSGFQIGFGIGIMSIIFLINALVIKFTGVKD